MKPIFNPSDIKFIVIVSLIGTLALSAADTLSTNSANTAEQSSNGDSSSIAVANDGGTVRDSDADAKTIQRKLNEQLSSAADFYQLLEAKPQTDIPNHVVVNAKGILMVNRWSAKVGGIAGGYAIGMKKMSNGQLSPPVFYSVAGASLGTQVDGEETHAIAFLMSDKAMRILNDDKFTLGGNVTVLAGPTSSSDSTVDNSADVVFYQDANSNDPGSAIAATSVSLDKERTRIFYHNPNITVDDIFAGQAKAPKLSKVIIAYYLNSQAKNIDPQLPPGETPGINPAPLPTVSTNALGQPIPGTVDSPLQVVPQQTIPQRTVPQ
jgi:lipid-binding SYLF domain-containing protein